MSVHDCGRGCGRQIFASSIPGGGAPVGMPGASRYTAAALECRNCRTQYCTRCVGRAPMLSPMSDCPSCGGDLAWPGVGGASPARVVGAMGGAAVGGVSMAVSKAPRAKNGAATFSFVISMLGFICCIFSMAPFATCVSVMINSVALLAGVFGILKSRNGGVGLGLSIAGIAFALFNLAMSFMMAIYSIFVGGFF